MLPMRPRQGWDLGQELVMRLTTSKQTDSIRTFKWPKSQAKINPWRIAYNSTIMLVAWLMKLEKSTKKQPFWSSKRSPKPTSLDYQEHYHPSIGGVRGASNGSRSPMNFFF